MELQTDTWCESLQQALGKIYEKNNDICQEKITAALYCAW